MKEQNYFKFITNKFGLSQYMRKLYKLGYYDNNVNKIGLMSRKKFSGISNENISSLIKKLKNLFIF